MSGAGDNSKRHPVLPLPQEFAGLVNLMAHPAASVAAVSAIGFGLASHGVGLWLGALSGAAEAMEKVLAAAATTEVAEPRRSAAKRAEAATRTLIADAKLVAREVAEAAPAAARPAVASVPKPKAKAAPAPRKPEKAAVMAPADFHAPPAMQKPRKPDDLKLIAGIGPKLEVVLNRLGVWTYGQIAAWRAEEIAWVEDYLAFKGRIGRDGWVEQAARLAGGRS